MLESFLESTLIVWPNLFVFKKFIIGLFLGNFLFLSRIFAYYFCIGKFLVDYNFYNFIHSSDVR